MSNTDKMRDLLNRMDGRQQLNEGYRIMPNIDRDRYGDREHEGLEGPINANGRALYYDKHEGRYYDPDTDMFLSHDEADEALRESGCDLGEGMRQFMRKIDPTIKSRLRSKANDLDDEAFDIEDDFGDLSGDMVTPGMSPRSLHRNASRYRKLAKEEQLDEISADLAKRVSDKREAQYRAASDELRAERQKNYWGPNGDAQRAINQAASEKTEKARDKWANVHRKYFKKKDAEFAKNNPPPPVEKLPPEEVAQLKAQLKSLKRDFDPYYAYSDDHSVFSRHEPTAREISRIERTLAQQGEQLDEVWPSGSFGNNYAIVDRMQSKAFDDDFKFDTAEEAYETLFNEVPDPRDRKDFYVVNRDGQSVRRNGESTYDFTIRTESPTDRLDEISRDTLKSYVKKANLDAMKHSSKSGTAAGQGKWDKDSHEKAFKRAQGVDRAVDRLSEAHDQITRELKQKLNESKKC